jgi:hypothetical protein
MKLFNNRCSVANASSACLCWVMSSLTARKWVISPVASAIGEMEADSQ